jgi:hypothetical protein
VNGPQPSNVGKGLVDQAGGKHAVGHSLSEKGIFGEFYIHMDRVEVSRDTGKGKYIGFGNGLSEGRFFPDLNIFELLLDHLATPYKS